MRVLIGYEESHRSYGQTLEGAIRWLRPGVEVSLARAEDLKEEVRRGDPHVVVCNRPNAVNPGGRVAWVRIPTDPEEPSEFCLDGLRRTSRNPDFKEILAFVDEAEELVRGGQDLCGC